LEGSSDIVVEFVLWGEMGETKKDVSQDIWCYGRDTNSILTEIPMCSDTAALACSVDCGFQSRLLHSCFIVSWDSTTFSRASYPLYKAVLLIVLIRI
jgi:hypothetical protein